MDLDTLMAGVSRRMNLPLKLDPETRRCVLQDKESHLEILIEFPQRNTALFIYSPLMQLPKEIDQAKFLESLLELNLFGLQTNGTTIGFDRKHGHIVLHHSVPLEFVDEQIFVNVLTNFIATARKISSRISDLQLVNQKRAKIANTHYTPAENAKPRQSMRIVRI
ncbi:MAG: CesT family type III secretion system chaperone [Puniceicoccales bacterium]|jgi:hypothetical protein|nr:CesT family type III secretion system chaperone [Puniceicoccales bacterium]